MKTNSQIALQNIDDFLTSLIPNELTFEINYESSTVKNQCRLVILINNIIVLDKTLVDETSSLTFKVPKQSNIKLEVKMLDKHEYDTLVEDDKIVKDTYIKFHNIVINGYDILVRHNFLKKYVDYLENDTASDFKPGFWGNNSFSLTFDWPFEFYFNDKTKNDDKFSMANLTDQSIETLKNELLISLQKLKH
jgi:hypothetical protein